MRTGLIILLLSISSAQADLIAYFNFEDSTVGGPPDFTSDSPPALLGETTVISTNISNDALLSVTPGLILNRWPTDQDPNILALGMVKSAANSPGNLDIAIPSSQGVFQDLSLSFAMNVHGNGYALVRLLFSLDGGATFSNSGNFVVLPPSGPLRVQFSVPLIANNATDLVLRIQFSGGQSNGNDLQDVVDNIRIEGTIVPEPSTVAGGLLGVLGLCVISRKKINAR